MHEGLRTRCVNAGRKLLDVIGMVHAMFMAPLQDVRAARHHLDLEPHRRCAPSPLAGQGRGGGTT